MVKPLNVSLPALIQTYSMTNPAGALTVVTGSLAFTLASAPAPAPLVLHGGVLPDPSPWTGRAPPSRRAATKRMAPSSASTPPTPANARPLSCAFFQLNSLLASSNTETPKATNRSLRDAPRQQREGTESSGSPLLALDSLSFPLAGTWIQCHTSRGGIAPSFTDNQSTKGC
jgi:hypothetical protein